MRRSEAHAARRAELRAPVVRHDVAFPLLFGSTDDSDLDRLVDPAQATTLFTPARLEHETE
jgi:predicted nucleotidyltransferase